MANYNPTDYVYPPFSLSSIFDIANFNTRFVEIQNELNGCKTEINNIDKNAVMKCTGDTFTLDGVANYRISAKGNITSLENGKIYTLSFPDYTFNNTTSSGNFYLNINNLGDKLLCWGTVSNPKGVITRQFSLPTGIYSVVYHSNTNSFSLYLPESLYGRMFQRFGDSYITCFGRNDLDSWYIARRLNAVKNSVTLAFTGADTVGYGLVENVAVRGFTNQDSLYLLFYNHTEKTLTAHNLLQYQYTYIIDSNTKLTNWANNIGGNNYTSVLIKSGSWSTNTAINLTQTGTKVVIGEPNSILNINANNSTIDGAFGYEENPTSFDYYMRNVTVITRGNSSGHSFSHCSNLYNCVANSRVGRTGFYYCNFLRDCSADGDYAYSHCVDLVSCIVQPYSTLSLRERGFNDCKGLRYCKCSEEFTNAYYGSYSSPTADSTYLCDNTLNGGWNQ